MDCQELGEFILEKMQMTHIYQPIMIKTLLKSEDNRATADDIAAEFLNQDISQLKYYKAIVRRWPHETLVKKRKIMSYSKGTYRLRLERALTEQERRDLVEKCDRRLAGFIDKDPAIRRIRELDRKSVSGSMRYDVLAKSRGVCTACGAKSTERSLHVDHIVPKSLGGPTEMGNLQALCYKCNTEKRNRDETDFMLWHKRMEFRNPKCGLCRPRKAARENRMAYAVPEGEGSVVVPVRHVGSFAEMIPAEMHLCMDLIGRVLSDERKKSPEAELGVSWMDGLRDGHCRIRIAPRVPAG